MHFIVNLIFYNLDSLLYLKSIFKNRGYFQLFGVVDKSILTVINKLKVVKLSKSQLFTRFICRCVSPQTPNPLKQFRISRVQNLLQTLMQFIQCLDKLRQAVNFYDKYLLLTYVLQSWINDLRLRWLLIRS